MMNKICASIVLGFLLLSSCQKDSRPQYSVAPGPNQSSSSLNPSEKQDTRPQYRSPKKDRWFFGLFRKRQKADWGDQLVAEYEQRMKRNAKEAAKRKKEMEKPQYSNPWYFGHKKPPKKRPPHKMKFCKVCKIRH